MPNLASTTLTAQLPSTPGPTMRFSTVQLDSITDVHTGDVLVIDREVMRVLDASVNPVRVMRGSVGVAVSHTSGATVYIGTPDRFRTMDPVGIPKYSDPNPWINIRDGRVWFFQGDQVGPNIGARYWQLQVIGPRVPGALGILQPPPTTP